MSLSDKLQAAASSKQLCILAELFINPKLSKQDQQNLIAIVDTDKNDPSYVPGAQIGRILREEGFDISNSTIDRHRRGDCGCGKKTK
jgi:hypothetical protein